MVYFFSNNIKIYNNVNLFVPTAVSCLCLDESFLKISVCKGVLEPDQKNWFLLHSFNNFNCLLSSYQTVDLSINILPLTQCSILWSLFLWPAFVLNLLVEWELNKYSYKILTFTLLIFTVSFQELRLRRWRPHLQGWIWSNQEQLPLPQQVWRTGQEPVSTLRYTLWC